MDSTIATSNGSPSEAGIAPDCRPMVHSATPNSPPIEIDDAGAQRLESRRGEWPGHERGHRGLQHDMPTSIVDTSPNSPNSRRTSSSMPTEMKNMPSRMSRNGRMTASI